MSEFYIFQQSRIWEGAGDRVDESKPPKRVKAKNEERARRRLPDPGLGRNWILVGTEQSGGSQS